MTEWGSGHNTVDEHDILFKLFKVMAMFSLLKVITMLSSTSRLVERLRFNYQAAVRQSGLPGMHQRVLGNSEEHHCG